MNSSAPTSAAEAADPPDLFELLQQRGLAHWYGLLIELCARFDGWLVDLMQDPEYSPDYRPLADVMKASAAFPLDRAGQDSAFARTVADCEFLSRAARDRYRGSIAWDPLQEPYTNFARRHPERFPYWDRMPIHSLDVLCAWMLGQLQCDPESGGCAQSTPPAQSAHPAPPVRGGMPGQAAP